MAVKQINNAFFGMPLSIKRGNPAPIDQTSIWESYADASLYASSDPTAYIGQVIAIYGETQDKDKDGNLLTNPDGSPKMVDTVGLYLIIDSDGTLLPVIDTASSGDIEVDLAKLTTRVGKIEGLIGTGTLTTTAKTIIDAINEINALGGGEIKLEVKPTPNTGMQTTYVLSQNDSVIGEIDIPISSGGDGGGSITLEKDADGNYVFKQDGVVIGTIPDLSGDINDLKDDISNIQTDIGTLQTDVGTLQTDVGGIKSDITTLQGDITDIKSDINDINTDIGDIKTQIGVGTLPNDSTDIIDAINDINDKIKDGIEPPEDDWATESDIDKLYNDIFSDLGW